MDFYKGRQSQMLQTATNRAAMYNTARPLECNTDGTQKDVLVKGGEGSKGGKVIGHTRSGKAIYDKFENPAHKKFSKKDHHDASFAHSKLSLVNGISVEDYNTHWDESGKHIMAAH